ncbi:hypothetical protein ALI22I_34880 [Saccharothrix sp. ALI-22-I]|uniref:hypothetical protein n=1 Tax=Saccharothrix sp. ALI-22-I TaxID=1933778 RepID=UPI00097C23B3|nr:hypothetical protein [Saccharothrix sp. ALI-22-I]ONI83656.1 hypothetical protein ALI22I_34880 [Saccharothrix sp. ALI-22-I]
MDTERLIRDALQLRAEQAPPEGNVLAALYRPKRSRKPLFLAITAATAAAAVAVVATTVGRPSAEAPPAGQSTTIPTTSAPASTTTTQNGTFRYSPTWLPDGQTERNRYVGADGGVQRVWKHRSKQVDASTFEMFVVLTPGEMQERLRQELANAPAADRVTINGTPAVIRDPSAVMAPKSGDTRPPSQPDGTPPDAEVILNPEPGLYLSLTLWNEPDARAFALRIAESLRPDTTPLRAPVSVGDAVAYQARADGNGGWLVSTSGEIGGVGYGANLSTYIDPPIGNPGVAPVAVTARGVPAEYLGQLNGYLRVDLGPQLHLLVVGSGPGTASVEALIAAAEAIEIEPNPDMSWTAI